MSLSLGLGLGLTQRTGNPFAAEIGMGAKLIVDYQGVKSGGSPYYWYNGTRYTSPANIPGWTFSRASTGYAENAAGVLIPFAANVPRITDKGLLVEEARTNLLPHSANMSTGPGWTPTTSTTVTNNGVLSGTPFNSVTVASGGAVWHRTSSISNISFTSGQTYSVSTYYAAGTSGNIYIEVWLPGVASAVAGPVGSPTVFSTAAGGITNVVTTNLGGYYKTTFIWTPNATGVANGHGLGPYSTTVGASVVALGMQIELGSFPTSYIVTTGAAATRAADNAYITGLGPILGQFRTNLLLQSQALDNASWLKTGTAVVPDAIVGPDGTLTVDKLNETAGGTSHNTNQNVTVTSGAQYTISAVVKAAERTWVALYEGVVGKGKWFNLATGAVGGNLIAAPDSAAIVDLGGGFYRCSITVTAASTAAGPSLWLSADGTTFSYSGTAGSGIYATQCQLETGSTATAYIPTTTAAVTVGNPFTMVAWADLPAADGVNRTLVTADDGAPSNRAEIMRAADNTLTFTPYVSAGVQAGAPASVAGMTGARTIKVAERVRAATVVAATNGALGAPVTTPPPLNMSRLMLGQSTFSSRSLNGYLQRVIIYGDLTDAQLQGQTA